MNASRCGWIWIAIAGYSLAGCGAASTDDPVGREEIGTDDRPVSGDGQDGSDVIAATEATTASTGVAEWRVKEIDGGLRVTGRDADGQRVPDARFDVWATIESPQRTRYVAKTPTAHKLVVRVTLVDPATTNEHYAGEVLIDTMTAQERTLFDAWVADTTSQNVAFGKLSCVAASAALVAAGFASGLCVTIVGCFAAGAAVGAAALAVCAECTFQVFGIQCGDDN